jgi:hypothetical protein
VTERDDYGLPAGYEARLEPAYFVDDLADQRIIHQPDVYPFAAHIAERYGCAYLIDVGCGRAGKLTPLGDRFHLIGIDHGANIAWCRDRTDLTMAIDHDLQRREPLPVSECIVGSSVVICADVIEHLVEPRPLVENLQHLAQVARAVVVTTPDRELVRGAEDRGPPANPAHVREWTLGELAGLLGESGAPVAFAGLTRNNDRDSQRRTSLVCLDPRATRPESAPDWFDVLAVICAYNEEDVIGEVVANLLAERVRVHVIDNWSSDGTVARLESLGASDRLTVERFPPEGPSSVSKWRALLERVEEVAVDSHASWVMHHDADEVRSAPWLECGLRDALYHADRAGFNAADHTLLEFLPVDDRRFRGGNLGAHFEFFEFGGMPGHFVQIKAWRRSNARVSLGPSGGHEASFPHRRVYPYKFLSRHYPLRSVEHARRKIDERRQRWDAAEREAGWHIRYDGYDEQSTFVWRREQLIAFEPGFFERDYLVERLSGVGLPRLADE